MVLVATGPAPMLAAEPGARLTLADGTLVTISAVLPMHIYSLHASVLGIMYFGSGSGSRLDEFRIYSTDGQMMQGYLFTAALPLLPIIVLGRRWQLPIGVPTAPGGSWLLLGGGAVAGVGGRAAGGGGGDGGGLRLERPTRISPGRLSPLRRLCGLRCARDEVRILPSSAHGGASPFPDHPGHAVPETSRTPERGGGLL
jgi:hypothetical protein